MCWIFHGKKPGKKKMEKRLKKEKLEQKIKGKPLQDMPLMKALAKSQEKSTQPHLVLTKKD
jgi:U4/U6.U5 tri-snRNP-associated protein 1